MLLSPKLNRALSAEGDTDDGILRNLMDARLDTGIDYPSTDQDPPRLADFLICLIPLKHRETLLGDLEEEYWTRLVPRHGVRIARLLYVVQAVYAFLGFAARDVGMFFDAVRKTPIHDWHVAAGAEFENVGQWKRPWYYPQNGESLEEAVRRECLATQRSIGILDYSTLGKNPSRRLTR